MTKFLLFVSIGIIIYLLLQPNSNEPLDKVEQTESIPIVSDPPIVETERELPISEEIQSLPVEDTLKVAPEAKKKAGLSGLKLIGTIYGSANASAMLADANNKTFVVRLRQKVLKSNYIVTRIEKDRIYLRNGEKSYMLVMNKVR